MKALTEKKLNFRRFVIKSTSNFKSQGNEKIELSPGDLQLPKFVK